MAILKDSDKQKVRQMFDSQFQDPVSVVLFHTEAEGESEPYTVATREILTTLADLSGGRISLREVNLTAEPEEAKRFGVDKTPALAMLNGQGEDQSLRFYGAPIGYEFMALLDDLVDVSRGETRLSQGAREQIKAITADVVIQVFSTPG